ncbi:MAG: peptidoglycan DD-metalloendopeptidase family protein [Actinomycetia bacterium]|nr:peptidoglycan DD-metalloendopeptidase family protein [Actinomycetes bacterium]
MSSDHLHQRAHHRARRLTMAVPRFSIFIGTGLLFVISATSVGAQTSGDVEHAKSDRNAAYQSVVRVEDQVEAALIEYDRAHTALEDVEEKVDLTQDRLEAYRLESDDLDARLGEAIVEAYVGSGSKDLSVTLVAETFQDVVMARYIGEQLRDRQRVDLNRLLVVSREVERLGDDLEANRAVMSVLAFEAQNAADVVQVSLESAQHILADAERDYQGIRAEYQEAQRKKRETELALIRANKSASVRGLPPVATTGFVCPVQGGASFINSWAFPRSGGRTHKGVDMFAKRGTPTPAVTSGTIKIRTVNLGGTVTYLYGDDGNKYYYAHLNGYPAGLRDGQRVEKGQTIGLVGNSGNAEGTSPHVHFEIRPGGGSAVNPYPTVRSACP